MRALRTFIMMLCVRCFVAEDTDTGTAVIVGRHVRLICLLKSAAKRLMI